jgi:tetratricopeptide (TPR) repeat protein
MRRGKDPPHLLLSDFLSADCLVMKEIAGTLRDEVKPVNAPRASRQIVRAFGRLLSKILQLFSVVVCLNTEIHTAQAQHSACINPASGLASPFELPLSLQFAQQYLDLHLIAQAIPCLENAHLLDRNASDTAYTLGRAYLDTGNAAAARALIESQLRIQDTPKLHSLLGAIDARQSQFREAAAQYQIVAQQEPNEQSIFDFGASLLYFAGPSAEQIFRYGISKYSDSERMHLGLAYAFHAQGQDAQAAQEMCNAAKLDSSDPRIWEMLGDTEQIPSSLRPEITEHLAKLMRMYPQNGKLLFYYAIALSGVWSGKELSHLDEVIPMLERAAVLDPKFAAPDFYLALRAEQKGRSAEALDRYKQAAILSPDDDRIAYRLAFAYKNAGDEAMFQKEMLRFRTLHEKANQSLNRAAERLQGIEANR